MTELHPGIVEHRLGEVLCRDEYAGGAFGAFGEHALLRNRNVGYIISANGNRKVQYDEQVRDRDFL